MNSEGKNGSNESGEVEFASPEEPEFVDTIVMCETGDTDNVGDASVEINVEQLIADFEGTEEEVSAKKLAVRRRLEELAEEKSFEDTFAIEFDND